MNSSDEATLVGGKKVNSPSSPPLDDHTKFSRLAFCSTNSSHQIPDWNFPNEIWKSHNWSHSIRTNLDRRCCTTAEQMHLTWHELRFLPFIRSQTRFHPSKYLLFSEMSSLSNVSLLGILENFLLVCTKFDVNSVESPSRLKSPRKLLLSIARFHRAFQLRSRT